MTKHHIYIIAAVGALLYWRSTKAKAAATNNAAPVQQGAAMQTLIQQMEMKP